MFVGGITFYIQDRIETYFHHSIVRQFYTEDPKSFTGNTIKSFFSTEDETSYQLRAPASPSGMAPLGEILRQS
jgi:hypothetical protein